MRIPSFNKRLYYAIVYLLFSTDAFSQIRLPKLISDGMILQRGEKVSVWGWASPREEITISFLGKTYHTAANGQGDWSVTLGAQKAGGPHQMVLKGRNELILKNILYGDVWLCSGQSNMELEMRRLIDVYPAVIAGAANEHIRQFLVPDAYDFNEERTDFSSGSWESVHSETVLNFSAVGYFFATELYRKYGVPVGLINAALGGSPAQAWMSERAIKKFPLYIQEWTRFKNRQFIDSIQKVEAESQQNWWATLNQGDLGLKRRWIEDERPNNEWLVMEMPNDFKTSELGGGGAVVWLKKEIELPAKWAGQPAKLLLGTIKDADSTFINGAFVGNTTYMYPPRRYLLTPGVLKPGKNSMTVRLVVNGGTGGFIKDKPYQLIMGTDTLSLAGEWKYRVGVKTAPSPSTTFIRWKPVGLYNAMIAPLKAFSLKGILWYQGESNTSNPDEYGALMRSLITDWRIAFQQDRLPFLYVQLANFMEEKTQPGVSHWASLREQQRKLANVPYTGMAVSLDLGEWNDIHPLNKFDVGKRLFLQAQKVAYKEKVFSSGPVVKNVKRRKDKVLIRFSAVGEGLLAKNGDLRHFALAGKDHVFVWAEARIVGKNKVELFSKGVPIPIKVRYAWADNPASANLYDSEGLPASSFELNVRK